MVGLEDAPDAGVEVVVIEVDGQLLVALQDHQEVAVEEVQALHHRVGLVQARLREDQHHEGVQQLFVLYQLHVAPRHLRTEIYYPAVIHLPEEQRQQVSVPRKVLPQDVAVVLQEQFGLVPQLGEQPVEQLLVLPVEQQARPLRVLLAYPL